MRAKDLMTYPVLTCHVNDSLSIAANIMWDYDCGVVPVVNDEGKLTSIITDRDICMATYLQNRSPSDILVNSAMSSHAITASADASAEDIERLMAQHQVRRIPIVDGDGKPIGIVSMADIAIAAARPGTTLREGRLLSTLASIDRPRHLKPEAA